jgi:hypothetical protein
MKSWTQIWLGLAAALLATTPAPAQPSPAPAMDAATTLFCKDDTGEIQMVKYASLGTVMRRFAERFNFKLSVQGAPMVLTFSNPGETEFFISYQAMPYHDDNGHSGIALLSAHISLENTDEVIQGTGMCYFTAFGRQIGAPPR